MSDVTMRAKFQVQQVIESVFQRDGEQHKYNETITAYPVYSPDEGTEDNMFWKASPSGSLSLVIDNPHLWGTITKGQKFYLDFTPAE